MLSPITHNDEQKHKARLSLFLTSSVLYLDSSGAERPSSSVLALHEGRLGVFSRLLQAIPSTAGRFTRKKNKNGKKIDNDDGEWKQQPTQSFCVRSLRARVTAQSSDRTVSTAPPVSSDP